MEKLPIEILVRIFRHLPQRDLISATIVCTLFSSVIAEYSLIKKLQLGVSNDESWIPARNYSEATVKNFKPNVHQRVFEALGDQLTTLKLTQSHLDLISIVNILQATPNLKFLTFDYTRIDDDSLSETVELPKLKDVVLVFNESDPAIFRVLQESSVTSADLRFYGDIPYSNFAEFVKFLRNQKSLTSLSVSGLYESNLFLIPMPKPTYQLREFKIDNCDLEEWEGLDSYLMEHVGSLEKFVVKSVNWDPSSIVNQCKKLKSLEVFNVELNSLVTQETVEELTLEPATIADRFPNVKKLFISRASAATFQTISRSMDKLEDVTVRFGAIAGLAVPTLRKLKLVSLDGAVDANFFVTHKKIEEMIFDNVYHIDDALLQALTINLSDLKVLKIIGDNHLTSRAFTIIRDNCKSLKVFEMKSWDQKFSRDDWKCLYDISGLQVYQETFI